MQDSSDSSIYNEATPSSSNFMYSTPYSGANFFTNNTPTTATKFCVFNSEQSGYTSTLSTSSFLPKTQISIVTDIANPLIRTTASIGKLVNWGSGNSLMNPSTGNTKSFALKDTNSVNYITLVSNLSNHKDVASNDQWYIYPKFFSTSNNGSPTDNPDPSNVDIPFAKFMSMSSPTFGSTSGYIYTSTGKTTTTQTVSIENKNNIAQIFDLKMYLGASTLNSTSVSNNPYAVRVTVRDSLNPINLSTDTSNNNNNVYCILSTNTNIITLSNGLSLVKQNTSTINIPNFELKPNQIMDITLMKIVASPPGVGSQDVAILFIDIENILYTTPILTLSSTGEEIINSVNTYCYGNETKMEFNCNLTPNNINGDTINGQDLTLHIYKKNAANAFELVSGSITSIVSNNNATFNITDNNKYDHGEYKAIVRYDSTKTNTNKLPDAKSHYKDGTSNEILFAIEKQPIGVVYNPTKLNIGTNKLTALYSILRNASFSDFLIYNSKSNVANKTIDIPGSIVFTVKNTNSDTLILLTKGSFNELEFSPQSNNFTYASTYNFNLTFTPTDTNILPFSTQSYIFTTETPILEHILYDLSNIATTSLLLTYLSNVTIECVLKDTSNDKYDSSLVSGNCVANFYKHPTDQTKDINLTLNYDVTSKTWKNSFTPNTLNLLRYASNTFNIVSSFDNSSITLTDNSVKVINFNGIQLHASINNDNPNTYDTVSITAIIKDKDNTTNSYSISDISGSITYDIKQGTNSIDSSTYTDLSPKSFIPNAFSLSTLTTDLTIDVSFNFTDTLVTAMNKIIDLNIKLIKPTIDISPTSEINDYHYGQTFDVVLAGVSGKKDVGTLYLYGKSIDANPFVAGQIANAILNQSHTFTNINIDDLVEDNVLVNLNQNQEVIGTIKWIPNNQNIYESVQDTFTIVLSKTTTTITNVTIVNNNCVFTEEIIISCNVASDYSTDNITGTIRLYDVSDFNKTTISESSVSTNNFSLIVKSPDVISYNFALEFIPTYPNVYHDSTVTPTTNLITFNTVPIVPIVTITNINTQTSLTGNTVDMPYTNNFKIGVANMTELNGTIIKISIGTDYTSEELTVANGQIEATGINFFELNKDKPTQIDITNSKAITLDFIGYNSSGSLTSHYTISGTNKNIKFVTDSTLPKINTITFNSQDTNQTSNSLKYDENFTITGNFNLIKDITNAVIPLQGKLLLFVGSTNGTPTELNDNLTLNSTDSTIVNTFKSSDYGILVGSRIFFFKFVPNDTNILPMISDSLNYTITAATISTVTLRLYPIATHEQTYFGESFGGTIGFDNIGVTGTMKIYCINPANADIRQEIYSINITASHDIGELSLDFQCAPISFDCPNDKTTYTIVVVFLSGDNTKFSDNEMTTQFSYEISRIGVKLSALTFDGESWNNFTTNNQRVVGDILTINGTIQTTNNDPVKDGHVELTSVNGDGSSQLALYQDDNTSTTYVSVAADGTFTCKLRLTSDSVFFTSPGSELQLLYKNNKNYANKDFEYEDILGIYGLFVSNKDVSLDSIYLTLDKSNLYTNSYSFSYHEDILHFYVEIDEIYNESSNPSIILQLKDVVSLAPVGDGNNGTIGSYLLDVTSINKNSKNIYFAEIYLNPKTANIIGSNDYSASCTFNATGYNSASEVLKNINGTQLAFNIEPTIPVIELTLDRSSINYLESVNITVNVKTKFAIQQYNTQTRNIIGTVTLKNQDVSGHTMNSITFDANKASSAGETVGYSPKDNSNPVITAIEKIFASFFPTYQNVSNKYTTAELSQPFTISKYAPELIINSISPVNDITHTLPNGSVVDDKFVYYDDFNKVVFNGVVNFNEKFQVICNLNKNLAGTIDYYYSFTDGSSFTKIIPTATVVTGDNGVTNESTHEIKATFNEKLLQIPSDRLYYLRAMFNPLPTDPLIDKSYYYGMDESPLFNFNIFQSNNFGVGKIFWDTQNNNIPAKTESYVSSRNINIHVSFEFDSSVNKSEKKCEVTFFHTSFTSDSNKFHDPIYIDLTDSDINTYTANFSVPATTFIYKYDGYPIRALFKPITNTTGTIIKNPNYPIVVEQIPLTLTIKPFITTPTHDFTYQYSDSIVFDVILNSGTDSVIPYTKLVFDVKNYDSNTVTYSKTTEISNFTGVSDVFPDFQNIINSTTNLIPGKYSLSIYATNDTNSGTIRTETFSTTFTIVKKDVTPNLTFDKYALTYKNPLTFSLNIGNFPLNVGESVVTFTNIANNTPINKTILYSDLALVTANNYNYTYSVADISSLLPVGIYNVDLSLNNMYYQGSQTHSASNILLVNKDMATISLPNAINNVAYGENIMLTASIKYGVTDISTGQLSLIINNGTSTPVNREFVVSNTSLDKGINNLVLSFVDINYVASAYSFQINVAKQSTNLPIVVLSTGSYTSTEAAFSLNLSNVVSSDTVTFYNLSSISELAFTFSALKSYSFNFTDLSYGDNHIYAIARSSTRDIKSNEITIHRNKYTASIALVSPLFASTYTANSLIGIKYIVSSSNSDITSVNGTVEFHKVIYTDDGATVNHDEIIGYVQVSNGSAQIIDYKLVANSNIKSDGSYYDNKIKFYAKFINSTDFTDCVSSDSSLISVKTKSASKIIDDTVLQSAYYLGDIVLLEYIAIKDTIIADGTITTAINAEQQAIIDLEIKNADLTDKNNLLDTATAAYNTAYNTATIKSGELSDATSALSAATSELTNATSALSNAKTLLDAVAIDKETAELAFKTIQEVTKLNNMSFPKQDAIDAINTSKSTYDIAKSVYDAKLQDYNDILSDISFKQSNLETKTYALIVAQQAYELALNTVVDKETELNTAQQAYEAKLLENNNDLLAIKGKQNEIMDNQHDIALIEDEYDTKKTNYETQLTIYDSIAASSDAAFTTASENYNSIDNLLSTEITNIFTLGDLSNIWMVIDQQSTSSTPQNPFIIVYTIKDDSTANVSWYKSKLFYGSNTGADITGPMLLYTGEDPTEIHPEILNRVKLDLNVGLSVGLQQQDEIVKAISIQTSSNVTSTNATDYNFIFKELKTIGIGNANNLSFLPTSSTNAPSVYADNVQGVQEGDGWGFNNTLLANGSMSKINWYVISNKSEEYTAQLVIESAAKTSAQNSKITASTILAPFSTAYDAIKTTYDGFISSITTKDGELLVLIANESNSRSELAALLTAINNLNNISTPTSAGLETAKTHYDTAVEELTTSKASLTIITNGKTILVTLNDSLNDKNKKYVAWNSFVQYIQLLNDNSPITINSVLSKMSDEASIEFDTNFSSWHTCLIEFNSKTGAQTIAQASKDTATTAANNASSAASAASAAKISASTDYTAASAASTVASTAKTNASAASKILLDPIALTSGFIVFYKEVINNGVTMTQILGQIKPDARGLVVLPYKLVDTGSVKFYAKITDLSDYYDSVTAPKTTNVSKKDTISITNHTVFNLPLLYKIGDSVSLSYSVTTSSSPVTEGTIAIYKKVPGNEQLLKYYDLNPSNNGQISHNHTLIDSGSVSFYAKYMYSSNNMDKIGSEQTINVVSKLNSSIQDISTPNTHKLGSTVNIAYLVTSTNGSTTTNINEGVVEVHKLVPGLDSIIGYLELSSSSNGNVSMSYDLVDVGSVIFYAVYMGTKNFFTANNNNQTKTTLTVIDKYTAQVTNTSNIGATKKLGDVVTLSYNVSYNSAQVNEGVFEISKLSNTTFNEILGYANISNGIATFTHKLVDIGDITLTGKFINSVNYKNENVFTNTVNVISQYVSTIGITSTINSQYKLGDSLTLEYIVTDTSNTKISSDGIIYIHKQVLTNDDIIYYAVPDTDGKISYNHKITALESTTFYAVFKESVNYNTSQTTNSTISVIKEYTTVTNSLSVLSAASKYGDQITLTSTLSSIIINEGNMDFYVTINGIEQLIGTSAIVNGVATLTYRVNDIGSIIFKSVFKNSANYVDVTSSNITMTVSKNDIVSISLPSFVSANEFDIVPIEATINYGNVLCYENLGSVEFTITNGTNVLTTNVDIIGNNATYKLYVANKTQYTIQAKYNGNAAFNASENTSISFTSSDNTNYQTLTYTKTLLTPSTNYSNMVATIHLRDVNVDNKFLLLNTGYVVFETIINGNTDVTKTLTIPLVNGTAQCNLRNETDYIYVVKFVDNISGPNVTITGTSN
jgi:hypothetical protein